MWQDEGKTGVFKASDGIEIFYRQVKAVDERARMVIAHGLGEHSGRYGNVLEALVPAGVSIWAPDHRGHGRSGGARGHVRAFDDYLDDLSRMVDLARADKPDDMKLFLLGHSLGGLMAVRFAQGHGDVLDGVVASSPALGLTVRVPAVKRMLGKVMSRLYPGLSMGNELDATKISRDSDVVKAYQEDPLVHDRVTARWFTEFLGAMEAAHREAAQIQIPILMQVAGDDQLANPDGSRRFFERLSVTDRILKVYDGLYHEVYNEAGADRARVLADLVSWIRDRV
ncbi:MAG: lysophospholipase [Deltaproteobacteria bacterium]|nr:lysophospholipase [Deltaproteobacteria bacterium]MBW1922943.1 lysophospholipase [Deltaproteobacteria bacterium]MBW1950690.1 lysophospholipase [Deltaproteobacteria bacterium]MBW2008538.1 lysophospholipase [Deltaproteobacteria bacterium]MBW2101612.1 lysophospholipase [Deltaproteobacteria bacterium]